MKLQLNPPMASFVSLLTDGEWDELLSTFSTRKLSKRGFHLMRIPPECDQPELQRYEN